MNKSLTTAICATLICLALLGEAQAQPIKFGASVSAGTGYGINLENGETFAPRGRHGVSIALAGGKIAIILSGSISNSFTRLDPSPSLAIIVSGPLGKIHLGGGIAHVLIPPYDGPGTGRHILSAFITPSIPLKIEGLSLQIGLGPALDLTTKTPSISLIIGLSFRLL